MLEKEIYPTPSRYFKKKLIRKIFDMFPFLKESHFLEIGCGAGEFLNMLDSLGFKGEGIDISEDVLRVAKKRVSKNIKVRKANLFQLKGRYKLVIMLDVLEHIENDENVIKKISSITEAGSYFLLSVPAHMKLFGEYDAFFGHFRRYEKDDLIKIMKKQGFVKEVFWSYGFAFMSRILRLFMRGKNNDNKKKRTEESGIKTYSFMKKWYPLISKFYPLIKLQFLTLNTDIGSQYLALFQKK